MAQYGRPSADTYNSDGWVDQGDGGSNIYTTIDETSASDADYIKSPSAPSSDVYVCALSSVEDPVSDDNHVMRYRYCKSASGGGTINLTVQLRQGYVNEGTPGTLIKEIQHSDISDTWTTNPYTLSTGEAGNISDYSSLFLRFVATQA